jgi:hydrogenase/urease accessory protein HupE
MMRRRFCHVAVLLAAALSLAGDARAHESRPGFLEIRQTAEESFEVLWKKPARGQLQLAMDPVFPLSCEQSGVQQTATPGSVVLRAVVTCPGGLAGQQVRIDGLEATLTDVLVRFHRLDGTIETHLLRSVSPVATIGGGDTAVGRAVAYLRLGIEHILLGVDHLLFVFGLMLIVGQRWMLVKTITSFTVAHSITLAIATLGFASAPVAPLNATIALSILFLGPEIVRAWRGETSFTIRHPWVVAFAFGLLHGFGFASGLSAMGLPESEIPLALLLFNVGVEVGQLAFVFLVLALVWSTRALEIAWPRWVEASPGYVVGSLGAFWTIQRTLVMLGVSL